MKTCHICCKTSDDFGIDKSQKDGLNRLCRLCLRQRNKNYYWSKYRERLLDVYYNKGGQELAKTKYKQNPLYYKLRTRTAQNKRISRKYNLREVFEPIDFLMVLERFEHQCFNCGANDVEHDLHVDHHMPRNLGWILSHNNAVVLCETCNGNKNQKHPRDFYTELRLAWLVEVFGVNSHIEHGFAHLKT